MFTQYWYWYPLSYFLSLGFAPAALIAMPTEPLHPVPAPVATPGLAVFTQYWYWYPLSYFLSLGFAPAALIAVDGEMRKPASAVHVAAKKSVHAYPPPLAQEASKEVGGWSWQHSLFVECAGRVVPAV